MRSAKAAVVSPPSQVFSSSLSSLPSAFFVHLFHSCSFSIAFFLFTNSLSSRILLVIRWTLFFSSDYPLSQTLGLHIYTYTTWSFVHSLSALSPLDLPPFLSLWITSLQTVQVHVPCAVILYFHWRCRETISVLLLLAYLLEEREREREREETKRRRE